MYIYELPFQINKELCRLLDNDDDWRELAGMHMKYSPFDINEIEQVAKLHTVSPTYQLFITWGQLNHKVEELFILLYRMKHIPALKCLVPIVDSRFQRLLHKHDSRSVKDKKSEVHNKKTEIVNGSESSVPLPVRLLEEGIDLVTESKLPFALLPTDNSNTTRDSTSTNNENVEKLDDEFLRSVSIIPMLKYEDLRVATNNWSPENELGRGGFGHVYKGLWKHLPVAVKKLQNSSVENKELIKEMCLNQYRHDNILPLYGYSFGGPESCLVYQLMAGGSLLQRLHVNPRNSAFPPLCWIERYKIAHGVARGLHYLHTVQKTPLIHGDIKPGNILLDKCMTPKIGDFGLARKGSDVIVSRLHGTRPYLPVEYLKLQCLSPAVDVFSFGVVMMEIATALPVKDRSRSEQMLSDYIYQLAQQNFDFATLEDPKLRNFEYSNPLLCRNFMAIGLHCTNYFKKDRPTMLEVYKELDEMVFPGKPCMD